MSRKTAPDSIFFPFLDGRKNKACEMYLSRRNFKIRRKILLSTLPNLEKQT